MIIDWVKQEMVDDGMFTLDISFAAFPHFRMNLQLPGFTFATGSKVHYPKTSIWRCAIVTSVLALIFHISKS
jgi:hypothetical protein